MPLKDPVARRAYHRQWSKRNKKKLRAYHAAWRSHPNHTASVRQAQKIYRENHPERARLSGQLYRLRKDGVPEDQIVLARYAVAIFEGRCYVTKKFRGIVCAYCNSAMGLVGDDPQLLRLLAEWIESHRERP